VEIDAPGRLVSREDGVGSGVSARGFLLEFANRGRGGREAVSALYRRERLGGGLLKELDPSNICSNAAGGQAKTGVSLPLAERSSWKRGGAVSCQDGVKHGSEDRRT